MKTALLAAGLLLVAASPSWSQGWSTAGDTESDRFFVTRSAQISMAEIELGKLAARKAQRAEVRSFATQTADEHIKIRPDLRGLAMQKYIPWPSFLDFEHRALRARLSQLSGDSFDRAYLQAVIERYRLIARDFRAQAQMGKDPEVKAWAAKSLPAIEERLKRAEAMSRSIGAPPVKQQAAR